MTAQQRRILGVGGGLVVLVALVLALTTTGTGDGERLAVQGRTEDAAPTTSPTTLLLPSGATDASSETTLPLVPVTTGVPVPDAVEEPPSTTAPSATPAPGPAPGAGRVAAAGPAPADATTVTAAGATITPSPSGAVRTVDKAKGCDSAADPSWKLQDCGALRTGGTVLIWLVETKGKASRALVLEEQAGAKWSVVLSAADVDGTKWSRIGVRGADVSGDGQPELLFGFHRKDAASTLSMDVVDSSPAVVVHRDLAGGAVTTSKGEITTYAAADGGYDKVSIRHTGGAWRASAAQRVGRSAVPASMI